MRNQALEKLKVTAQVFPVYALVFYAVILAIITTSHLPRLPKQAFQLKKAFDAGEEGIFRLLDPGTPFSIFGSSFSKKEPVSFIMDHSYSPYDMSVERFQAAQRYFAPRLLTPYPTEKKAIFFCSSNNTAILRMKEAGYRPLHSLGNGKYIAEKIP